MSRHRLLVLAALSLPAAAFAGSSWPQFRGPTMQGVSDETNLPAVLDAKEHVAWRTEVHGKGWSSPVVADGKVWVSTATADGRELSVLRLDAKTGKVEFDEVLFKVANPQYCIPFNSYASPTPVIEGDRVYVSFGSPGTACLDAKTGAKVWERTDFVCNHYRGSGTSPTLSGDKLFLNFDGSDFQFVAALDKATGKTVWRTDRSVDYKDTDPKTNKPKADGDFRKGFSTARVTSFGGKEQLLSVGGRAAYGYDLATGKELWRFDFAAINNGAHTPAVTPVIGPEHIYFCTGNGGGELLAVKPGNDGVVAAASVVWRVKKNVPGRPSPLLHDGLIYTVDDGAMATCVDAKTGEEVWKQRLDGKSFSASPLMADGKVYFFSEAGVVTTIAPGRAFKKLGQGEFPEGFMGSPAVADGAFFLRTKTALYRVQN